MFKYKKYGLFEDVKSYVEIKDSIVWFLGADFLPKINFK